MFNQIFLLSAVYFFLIGRSHGIRFRREGNQEFYYYYYGDISFKYWLMQYALDSPITIIYSNDENIPFLSNMKPLRTKTPAKTFILERWI